MTRQSLVLGNWKMHGDEAFCDDFCRELVLCKTTVEVGLMVPFPFLHRVRTQLENSAFIWGGQNVSQYEQGAYTGEVSARMLHDLACTYVLVGHSERRALFGEAEDIISQKFTAAQQAGLIPVLCVGETLSERESGKHLAVVARQCESVFNAVSSIASHPFVLAYEPVWAIGTGKVASPEMVQSMHAHMRSVVGQFDERIAHALRILYGGSLKPQNAADIFQLPDVDGGLIGGASLRIETFTEVVELCRKYC